MENTKPGIFQNYRAMGGALLKGLFLSAWWWVLVYLYAGGGLMNDLNDLRLARIQEILDHRFYVSGSDLEQEIKWLITTIRALRVELTKEQGMVKAYARECKEKP